MTRGAALADGLRHYTDVSAYAQHLDARLLSDVAAFAKEQGWTAASVANELIGLRHRCAVLQASNAPFIDKVVDVRQWERYFRSNNCYAFGSGTLETRRANFKLQPGASFDSNANHVGQGACRRIAEDMAIDLYGR